MKAEIFSKDSCPFCVHAKTLLETRGVPYEEIDAVAQKSVLIERVTRDTGSAPRTVPQIYLDGRHIGGYTELKAYFAQLDEKEAEA